MKLRSHLALLSVFALALGSSAQAAVETYTIDAVHSSVGFTIRHTVGKTAGRFTDFTGTIAVDRENLEASTVQATIQATSISTADEKRDAHLKNPDFFEVAKYPTLIFKSTSWKKTGEDTFDVTGDLTIHGVTKPALLKVTSLGFADGMKPGSKLSGWEATTKVNRRDFGVNGPTMLGKMVGDDVNITITVEAGSKA